MTTRRPDPIRYDSVTIDPMVVCAWCTAPFARSGRRRFCSAACKQASWRAGRAEPSPGPPTAARPDDTVYECPACEARYLGARRCEDCNLFCRRIGPGAPCPHCDQPVAHVDLDP